MPFSDGPTHADSVLHAQVCIVGAGPAGVAVAAALAEHDIDVVVLESGGRYADRHDRANARSSVGTHVSGAQSATRGRILGHPYYPLRLSRARGVGGSMAALKSHGLRSRPIDPVDVERPVDTPWPIAYEELARHLGRAADLCGLSDPDVDWRDEDVHSLDGTPSVRAVGFAHGDRRAVADRAAALAGSGQRWVTDATVTGFDVDADGFVSRVHVRTRSGDRFAVEARSVVIAMGGVDNPRSLLASPSIVEHMGASADHVGRYFMEHLHYAAGILVPRTPEAFARIYDEFCEIDEQRWITPSPASVGPGAARSVFVPIPAHSSSVAPGVQAFGRMIRSVPFGPFAAEWWRRDLADVWRDRRDVASAIAGRVRSSAGYDGFVLGAMSEQSPDRESRITLSSSTDRYGVPLADLHWGITADDLAAARRAADVVGGAFADHGDTDFVSGWNDGRTPAFQGGWHHMGTTRMSDAPDDGVVDGDARVHGIANLHVAGSSVFPTGGFANPTLTLVALALRLGEHLAGAEPRPDETPA